MGRIRRNLKNNKKYRQENSEENPCTIKGQGNITESSQPGLQEALSQVRDFIFAFWFSEASKTLSNA